MKHIAVILRGHVRTWEYTHKAIFDFYDSIAEDVDYYFVTWRLPDFYNKPIEDSFEKYNKRLIKLLAIYDEMFYTSWLGPSWFNYSIIPYKRQREREVKYDAVFDTRPDIMYRLIKNKTVLDIEPNTLYTSGFVSQIGPDNKRHIGVEDHFFISSNEVYNIMNTRHVYIDDIGCQAKILQFANDEGINVNKIDWVEASIVRPNAFICKPNPTEYFNRSIEPSHNIISQEWIDMPVEKKLSILHSHNIREADYRTASITAKL
jgi:hypothetical protein